MRRFTVSTSPGSDLRRSTMSITSPFTVTWMATCSHLKEWQYSRVRLTGADFRFRSGLYVLGANHGQFNTGWGSQDTLAGSVVGLWTTRALWMVMRKGKSAAYISPRSWKRFCMTSVTTCPFCRCSEEPPHGCRTFFSSTNTLIRTIFVLVDFEDDLDPVTLTANGGSIEGENLSRWYETGNELKYDKLDTHSAVFAWDERYSAQTARISFGLPVPVAPESLLFSLSAVGVASLPPGFDAQFGRRGRHWKTQSIGQSKCAMSTVTARALPCRWTPPLYPLINAIPRRAKFLDQTEPTGCCFDGSNYRLMHSPVTVNHLIDRSYQPSLSFSTNRLAAQ